MVHAVAEMADGWKHGLSQGVGPSAILAVVVGLRFPERIGFRAQRATHAKRHDIAPNVPLRYVVSLLFDVGLLRAVGRWFLAVAFAECSPDDTISAEA